MPISQDKHTVDCWLRLYNRLFASTYRITKWPDEDSSKENIDALCQDDAGKMLAIEHTRIEPFSGEKADAHRFAETLAALENHPDLLQPGFNIDISQHIGSIPVGTNWKHIQEEMKNRLKEVLPKLKEGPSTITVGGKKWSVELKILKTRFEGPGLGRLYTARIWPGDPDGALVLKALRDKIPKLSCHADAKRILLLEKYAVAGTIENQFGRLQDNDEVPCLLANINEVWSVNTMCLEREQTIFTNQIWPSLRLHFSSLNVVTGVFRKLDRE